MWNCSSSFPWVSSPWWLSFYLSPSNIFSWVDPGHALLRGNHRNGAELFPTHLIKRHVMTYLITGGDNLDHHLRSARCLHWSHHFPLYLITMGRCSGIIHIIILFAVRISPISVSIHGYWSSMYKYHEYPPHASTTTVVTQIMMIYFPHFYYIYCFLL